MAIMNKMRENTHIILFILLVLFLLSMTIGGLVGGADITSIISGHKPNTVVAVNGENIPYEQYNNIRQQQFDAYRKKNGKEPTGFELQQLEDQIFESVVRDVLIKQLTEKMNIQITKKEIAFNIFENPPQFLRTNPTFADSNGNFDMNKYKAALADERNLQYWSVVQNYLAGTLPFEKVQQEVLSTAFVTDDEVKEDFIKRNQKVKVKYIFFNPNLHPVKAEDIPKPEVEKYYKEHKDDFTDEEQRRIRYVLFELKPTADDTAEIKSFALSLLDSLKQGAEFAELAKNYSEDPGSAVNGGELGYFSKGMMVKPFEAAAFSAKPGQVVGPILSQHGFHIIKVEDKKVVDGKEQVKARHILLRITASRRTSESVKDDADYFAEQAADQGFEKAVQAENVKVDTTDYFNESGFIPGLGVQKRMAQKIFNSKIGKPSRLRYLEDKGYLIYELIDVKKARLQPLEEVEKIIRNTLRQDKQKELAGEACRKFRERIQSPEDFEKLAAEDSLVVKETVFFPMSGFVRGVGKDPNFIGTAFGLEIGEISGPVKGLRGYYLLKMLEKQDFNESLYSLQKNNLKYDMAQNEQRAIYNEWYKQLKSKAKIEDYRYKFYN
ncbi:MAG: hypothetical protein GXO74_13445 [Calditrichaeota bacterium]|nr:hypothetical protein [Calditrichota bacterium]